MGDDGNVELVYTNMFTDSSKLVKELNDLNESIKVLLPAEEAEKDQVEWFGPNTATLDYFASTVDTWMEEAHQCSAANKTDAEVQPRDSIANI